MPHDTDRTQLEFASEYGEFPELSSEQYEYPGEAGSVLGEIINEAQAESAYEGGYGEYQELPLPEAMEDELASELLEVSSDQELDHFLGSLFHRVASGIGKVIKSPIGQALGGILKTVAKKALPIAGGALGTFVGGPLGGALGSKLASAAGNAFGLEQEGLSSEDRDFEAARRYVRFAAHAARRAAHVHPHLDPVSAAKAAVVDAAKKHAPGLLAPLSVAAAGVAPTAGASILHPAATVPRPAAAGAYPVTSFGPHPSQVACPTCGGVSGRHPRQGKWIRRGRHIVLLGV